MRELDVFVGGWLARHGTSASAEALDSFDALLDVEDDLLFAWCMGRAQPPRADWQQLIADFKSSRSA